MDQTLPEYICSPSESPVPEQVWPKLLKRHLRDGIAEAISCPTLVLDAEGAHCQVGANRLAFARIYNRVDETLKP